MDQYTKDTIERYKSDRKKFIDLDKQIKEFQAEASKLLGMLSAYERILQNSIGHEAFKNLHDEIELATTSISATQSNAHASFSSEVSADELTITDIILKIISESGSNGMTAAQVFVAVQSFGIGIEKRNTIYGTLSRLKTNNRLKKVGKRFFSTQN